jgi:predicted metal-dependent hydrolase
LSVSSDGTLIVRAPLRAPLLFIERFINDKKDWIQTTTAKVSSRPRAKKKEFISGELFLYLGKQFPLQVSNDVPKGVSLRADTFYLHSANQPKAQLAFTNWYKERAKEYLHARTALIAQKYGFEYRSIKISSALRRWGSCSAKGNLNFTWRLILTPESIIEYVICHELAHLRHHNHSKRFWDEVRSMYPNYTEARNWLRTNEQSIKI